MAKVSKHIRALEIEFVFPNPRQQRKQFDAVKLEELTRSIKSEGQQTAGEAVKIESTEEACNLLAQYEALGDQIDDVRQGAMERLRKVVDAAKARKVSDKLHDPVYVIVMGERRYRACLLAGLSTYNADVVQGVEALTIQRRAFIENIVRQDLTFVEEAWGLLDYLKESGRSPFDNADSRADAVSYAVETLGKSATWVSDRLNFFSLTEYAQKVAADGKLTFTMIYHLARMTASEQDVLVKQVESGKIETAGQFQSAVKAMQQKAAHQETVIDLSQYSSEEKDMHRKRIKTELNGVRDALQKLWSNEEHWDALGPLDLAHIELIVNDIAFLGSRLKLSKVQDLKAAQRLEKDVTAS